MSAHSATSQFPPVERLTEQELRAIVDRAPRNRLLWSAREKDAWQELQRRPLAL